MTVGENIKKIRIKREMTQKELGNLVGVNESYIRAYESGKRNPKQNSLESIAKALHVDIEVLINSEFDEIKAMHRLFQIFKQYDGYLFEHLDPTGNKIIGIAFEQLPLIQTWFNRYEKYLQEIKDSNHIKNPKERGNALIKAESEFDFWMDIFPELER